jgi:phenylalanyl-tRNA synthetase beta chain
MKLSLAWIFEHIAGTHHLDSGDIDRLIADFNRKTAEIEAIEYWSLDKHSFALGIVIKQSSDDCTVSIDEWGTTVTVSGRSDLSVGGAALIKRDGDIIRWAVYGDFEVERDGVIAPVHHVAGQEDGSWKKGIIWKDTIFDVDNKSGTHRPDMWGHRGFAREIAMLLDLELKDESHFLTKLPLVEHGLKNCPPSDDMPFAINNNAPVQCSRFTATYFDSVQHTSSFLPMVFRLLSVDAKPINGLVDLTNYIMLDWGQPVHAYDAATIEDKTVIVRPAMDEEKLT